MKQLSFLSRFFLIVMLFCFAHYYANAQIYDQVFNTSGTANFTCANVTVTSSGDAAYYGNWCGAQPYLIGSGSGGSFTYTFSVPVYNIRVLTSAMDYGEEIEFYINGVHYALSSSNLSTFNGTCSSANANCTITGSGDLGVALNTTTTTGAGAQVDIEYCSGINSITVSENTGSGYGSVFSFLFYPISIAQQPINSAICLLSNTSLSVAMCPSGLSCLYQWQVNAGSGFANVTNGGVYSGATSATLNISGATSSMNGYIYRCKITYGACTSVLTSNNAALTLYALPTISISPSSATVCAGQVVNFSASGASSYLWTTNGPNSPSCVGANPPCSTASATPSVTQTYTVTGTDANGCVANTSAVVTVNPLPTISLGSIASVCPGASSVSLPVTAVSNSPGTYSISNWNNTSIGNVTNASLPGSIPGAITINIPSNLTPGTYTGTLTVKNGSTGCISNNYTISFTVNAPPGISITTPIAVCV